MRHRLTICMLSVAIAGCVSSIKCSKEEIKPLPVGKVEEMKLVTSDKTVNRLFKMSGKLISEVTKAKKQGIMKRKAGILNAGKQYHKPWTRDASYNTIYSVALLYPETARNTLESVIEDKERFGHVIGGQYWDAIVWVTAAWDYYLYSGDEEFLKTAYDISCNSIRYFEATQFDAKLHLFNGPATFQDGIAGYPPPYADAGGSSFILDVGKKRPQTTKNGNLIVKALSTNCLYANAYSVLAKMADHFKHDKKPFEQKTAALKEAINRNFWMADKERYCYLIDMTGKKHDFMEATGNAFLISFGIAPQQRVKSILKNQYVSKYGIPCVWPVFKRFGQEFGRHNGTVWPFCQGYWARACAEQRDLERFNNEFTALTDCVNRDKDFGEIYHPVTGKNYGGIQCGRLWHSCKGQTWTATAYQSMLFHGVAGLRVNIDGIKLDPMLPDSINTVEIKDLKVRDLILDITIKGKGATIKNCLINGVSSKAGLSFKSKGRYKVEIILE